MAIGRSLAIRAGSGLLALAALLLPAALAWADEPHPPPPPMDQPHPPPPPREGAHPPPPPPRSAERADYANRAGRWEFFGTGVYRSEGPTTFRTDSGDVKVHVENSGMGGFGAAYNFTDQLALRFDTRFGDTVSRGTGLQTGGHSDVFLNDGRVNLEWNVLRSRVTPFVTGGIGFQYVEIELQNVDPVPVCYWDPWYGYYCGYSKPVFTETDFAWNVGAGLRWDVTDHLVLRAALDAGWVDYQHSKSVTGLLNGVFTIGWMF